MVANKHRELLKLDNLTLNFTFKNQIVSLLKEISFSINEGEILGITGYSGSGKSMTSLSIMGLTKYLDHLHISGSIYFNGIDLLKLKESDLALIRGAQMCMVIQQPIEAFNPVKKLGKQMEEAVRIHQSNISTGNIKGLIFDTLSEVGLTEQEKFLRAFPHELSGGQLQRMAIAMSIINNPKLLIVDEPTSSLDIDSAEDINVLLQKLVANRKMSLIYISHDISLIKELSHRIIVLERGKIKGDNINLKSDSLKMNTDVVEYLNQKIEKVNREREIVGIYEKLKVENICKSYDKSSFFGFKKERMQVLNDVNFSLKEGQMLGILGPSGSGKSTLVKIIAGLISPDSGSLFLNKKIYDKAGLESDKNCRKKIQMIMQSSYSSLQPKMTVGEQWHEVYRLYHSHNKNSFEIEIENWLQDTGLPKEVLFKYPSQLSGGQQQRAALVRSLLSNPELVIFDESLSSLDIWHQNLMIDLIVKLQDKYHFSGLFITHDIKLANAICHHTLFIKNGTLMEN